MCLGRQFLRLMVIAMALLLALPGHWVFAKGSGESEVARSTRAKGTVSLNLGQYEDAIEQFSQAYALTQDPILLYSLGQAYRLAGKPDKAVASYSSFLRAAGPGTKYRAQFERAAAEIETITPTLVCPPKDHPGTGKQLDDDKQIDELMDAPAAKRTRAPKPVDPPPAEESQEVEAIEPPPVAKAPALTPPPVPAPALTLVAQAAPVETDSAPVYKKAWFWSGVVGVLAIGAVATWYFTRSQNQAPASTYGTTRVLP